MDLTYTTGELDLHEGDKTPALCDADGNLKVALVAGSEDLADAAADIAAATPGLVTASSDLADAAADLAGISTAAKQDDIITLLEGGITVNPGNTQNTIPWFIGGNSTPGATTSNLMLTVGGFDPDAGFTRAFNLDADSHLYTRSTAIGNVDDAAWSGTGDATVISLLKALVLAA